MGDLLFTRSERLAVVLRVATLLRLAGDDLRLLALLLDADEEVDAGRAAAFGRLVALVDQAGTRKFTEWLGDLDSAAHALLADDAELTLGLTIEPRPPIEAEPDTRGTE